MMPTSDLWLMVIVLGLGSFGMRYLFLGLVGRKAMPDWLLRHLRYTAVAILPALVTPLVVWPSQTGGQVDPLRLAAAALAFGVGAITRNVFAAMGTGGMVFWGVPALWRVFG
ncbi:MAG: AzlD domain-containing protein [Paracoccaceae bacterium]